MWNNVITFLSDNYKDKVFTYLYCKCKSNKMDLLLSQACFRMWLWDILVLGILGLHCGSLGSWDCTVGPSEPWTLGPLDLWYALVCFGMLRYALVCLVSFGTVCYSLLQFATVCYSLVLQLNSSFLNQIKFCLGRSRNFRAAITFEYYWSSYVLIWCWSNIPCPVV